MELRGSESTLSVGSDEDETIENLSFLSSWKTISLAENSEMSMNNGEPFIRHLIQTTLGTSQL